MTWTYSGDPSASEKDTVRFLIQDIDENEPLVSDEEITYAVDTWYELKGSLQYCAAVVADILSAKYTREASYSADGVSVNMAQAAQQFRDLAMALREQHKNLLVGGSPDVGGISPYEGLYPGVKNFAFGTGMHDDVQAGSQDYGSTDVLFPIEDYPGT